MFLAAQFFDERPPPQFLDLHYKIQPVSDHVAKFSGDQQRELGNFLAKEKTSAVKHKPARNYVSELPFRAA